VRVAVERDGKRVLRATLRGPDALADFAFALGAAPSEMLRISLELKGKGAWSASLGVVVAGVAVGGATSRVAAAPEPLQLASVPEPRAWLGLAVLLTALALSSASTRTRRPARPARRASCRRSPGSR
jgi:hypothetical protein